VCRFLFAVRSSGFQVPGFTRAEPRTQNPESRTWNPNAAHELGTGNPEPETTDGDAMIGVVVVTHGQLATELVNAAETIVGDLPQFAAVSIGWHEDTEDARKEIQQAIARVHRDGGVLLVTDMFGGTPSNLAMTFLSEGAVEVLTGVNLPMLIKLANLPERADLLAAAREMREHGRNAIWVASDLLRGEKTGDRT
jgi:PTS system mannose-specific IIA component